MPSPGTFVIQELGRVGSRDGGRPDGAAGERFEWTAARRSAPRRPWVQGGALRNVKTYYGGAVTASGQVLGPKDNNHQFNGRWDDRYNSPGFARSERNRFEAMCKRGNLVRVSFQDYTYEGLIVDWKFPYKIDSEILYQITLDVYARVGEFDNTSRSPDTTRSPSQAFDDINDLVNAIALKQEEALRENGLEARLETEAVAASKTAVASMTRNRSALGDTLDQRELTVDALGSDAVSPFRRLATQMRTVGSDAFNVIDSLIMVRSDLDLAARTALATLSFEDWSRSIRFQSRVLLGTSIVAANEMDERATPEALRLYRPHQGESLYAISRLFYGTPHSWRLIADANQLSDFELTGDETLIIPERGAG